MTGTSDSGAVLIGGAAGGSGRVVGVMSGYDASGPTPKGWRYIIEAPPSAWTGSAKFVRVSYSEVSPDSLTLAPFSGEASRRIAACRVSETEGKDAGACDHLAELYTRGQQAAESWVEAVVIAEKQDRVAPDLLVLIDEQRQEADANIEGLDALTEKTNLIRGGNWLVARELAADIDEIADAVDRPQ